MALHVESQAPDGGPPRAGQLIYNRDLAATLRSLAEHGAAKGEDPSGSLGGEHRLPRVKHLLLWYQ